MLATKRSAGVVLGGELEGAVVHRVESRQASGTTLASLITWWPTLRLSFPGTVIHE